MRIAAGFVSDLPVERGKTPMIDDESRVSHFSGVLQLVRQRRGAAIGRQPRLDGDPQEPPATGGNDESRRAHELVMAVERHRRDVNQEIRAFEPID